MPEKADVLLQFWREQRDQARQSEDQRAIMTNIILVISSAGMGLIAQHGLHDRAMLLITVPLALLGAFGAVASMKYRERYELHISEARLYRRRIDELFPDLKLENIWQSARIAHRKQHPRLHRIRLYYLWTTVPLAIMVAGVSLTIAIAVAGRPSAR